MSSVPKTVSCMCCFPQLLHV